MLRQRVLVVLLLLPLGLGLVYLGGYYFLGLIALVLGMASWEYARLFRKGGFQPAMVLTVLGTVALAVGRGLSDFASDHWILSAFLLICLVHHLVRFERGRDQAATDFAITLSGVLYIGWLGAYLISLRNMPSGIWWFLVALPSVWAADSGAFFYGRRFGKRKLCPRLSPKKTWEGYFAGIVSGVIVGALLAYIFSLQAPLGAGITPLRGALLGLVLSVFPTLGDLGESMVKRQVGVKDSGTLLPGHGGVFDRIDSWIWGGALSYYLITSFFL